MNCRANFSLSPRHDKSWATEIVDQALACKAHTKVCTTITVDQTSVCKAHTKVWTMANLLSSFDADKPGAGHNLNPTFFQLVSK